MKLSALMIFQNNRDTLERCLKSLAFCDEIVAIDGGSSDGSNELATSLGCRVVQHPFSGVNHQKEFGRNLVQGEWVLNLDSDEFVSAPLAREILQLLESTTNFNGFRIPVRTEIEGRPLRHGGWWPNRQKRLFRTQEGRWNPSLEPHDHVELHGRWGRLTQAIEHRPPGGWTKLREKSERYGVQAGQSLFDGGRGYTWGSRWIRPAWRGVKAYLLYAGFLDGRKGFDWAAWQMLEGWTKYETLRKLHAEVRHHGQNPVKCGTTAQDDLKKSEDDHAPANP